MCVCVLIYVCIYIYIYIYIYICLLMIYVCVCVYIDKFRHILMYMYLYTHGWIHLCIFLSVSLYICTCKLYMYMYVCVCVCVCVCVKVLVLCLLLVSWYIASKIKLIHLFSFNNCKHLCHILEKGWSNCLQRLWCLGSEGKKCTTVKRANLFLSSQVHFWLLREPRSQPLWTLWLHRSLWTYNYKPRW